MHEDRSAPGTDMSTAIQVARVVCIFFMMYAHDDRFPVVAIGSGNPGNSTLGMGAYFLSEGLARASVPLLSTISGWLFAATFRGEILATVTHRARTLLVPMVIWNLIGIASLTLAALLLAGHVSNLRW